MKIYKHVWFLTICFLIGCSNRPIYFKSENHYQKYDADFSNTSYMIKRVNLKGKKDFINALDVSMVDLIEENGGSYYNYQGKKIDFFQFIKENNITAIRVRLFNDYQSEYGVKGGGKLDKERVLRIFKRAKQQNLKLILDFHFSDTWADPNNQKIPYAWKDLNFEQLVGEVYQYTKNTLKFFYDEKIDIDYIQMGNEIDYGMLFPFGQINWESQETINSSFEQLSLILNNISCAIREIYPNSKIIIHLANALKNHYGLPYDGIYFLEKIINLEVDFDIIGSSFYSFFDKETPIESIANSIDELTTRFNKSFMLLEFSYGYTTKTHPLANNVLSIEDELTDYPLSIQGQTNYIIDVISQVYKSKNGIGTCYWGGEYLPIKNCGWADENTLASWSNQALFTYEGVALPTFYLYQTIFD